MFCHCMILWVLFIDCVGTWGWSLRNEKVSEISSSLFPNSRNGSKYHTFYYSEREVRGGSVMVISA